MGAGIGPEGSAPGRPRGHPARVSRVAPNPGAPGVAVQHKIAILEVMRMLRREPLEHREHRLGRRHAEWSWRREVVELSVLFLAVGTAGMFTEVLGRRHYGWSLLIVLGAVLLAASVLQWWWRAHGPGRLRGGKPFVAVRPVAGAEAAGGGGTEEHTAELQAHSFLSH